MYLVLYNIMCKPPHKQWIRTVLLYNQFPNEMFNHNSSKNVKYVVFPCEYNVKSIFCLLKLQLYVIMCHNML